MPLDTAAVLIPVKAFALAKVRLASVLDDEARATLARSMAERVVAAAHPLPVWCICDDPDVAEWAESRGAGVQWTPGLDLNAAVQTASAALADSGVARVVVAHGDLPFAAALAGLADAATDEAVIAPDRRSQGSNVVSVPTDVGFRFAYGEGSFERHCAEARRRGLSVRVVRDEHLAWDVDEPDDLDAPPHLGPLPGPTAGATIPQHEPEPGT